MTDNSFCNLRTMSSPSYMKWTNYFTIIELLVVISIIAILVSILLQALKTARDKVRGTVCLSGSPQLWKLSPDPSVSPGGASDRHLHRPVPEKSSAGILWEKNRFLGNRPDFFTSSCDPSAHKKGSSKSFLPKITLQIEEKSCFLQQNNKCEGITVIRSRN